MVNVSDNIKEWDLNETIQITNTYTDSNDTLVDPDSITLKIYDPTGSLIKSVTYPGDIIKSSVGAYHYNYDIPADGNTGWWSNIWTAVFGVTEDVTKAQFKVRDPERRLYTQPAYVYSRAGQDENFVSEKDVNYFIVESMAEVDSLMGKCYNYSTPAEEWFNTEEPDCNTKVTKLFLGKRPIRSIVSVEEYDTSGDLVETHTSSDYYIDEKTGMLGLRTKEFEHQARRVKIAYNYGFDEVPPQIQQLTTIIAVIKLLLVHIGSSVDEITSFSACGLSMGVGEPYVASARAVEMEIKEMNRIIAAIGRQRQSIFVV